MQNQRAVCACACMHVGVCGGCVCATRFVVVGVGGEVCVRACVRVCDGVSERGEIESECAYACAYTNQNQQTTNHENAKITLTAHKRRSNKRKKRKR